VVHQTGYRAMSRRGKPLSRVLIPARGWLVFAHDIVMAAVSYVLSLYLRFGNNLLTAASPQTLVQSTVAFTAIAATIFMLMGLYRGVWRYASLNDMMAIARATTLTVVVFVLVVFVWTRLESVPRSVPFINWFVLTALLGGPRFFYRSFKDRRLEFKLAAYAGRQVPVLLAGTGDGAELFLRALRHGPQRPYRALGIVAEKRKRVGHRIHGVPVLGTLDDVEAVAADLKARGDPPERLILTEEETDGATVRRLLDAATAAGMTVARLPRLTDLRSGISDDVQVRPIAVEDLLGRPQTPLDRDSMRQLIAGRRLLVTGAGGSIGGELVRQITAFEPAALLLLDHGEYNLYQIEMEVRDRHPDLTCPPVLADVRDRARVRAIFAAHRPELVFHAAALKHVPMVEANPIEGVMTNVIGTVNVADACVETGVAAMVLISTDKAVNPSSVMGATKRLAEAYCQAREARRSRDGSTRFLTVRFGNVLGSTGSVVPLFQRQLADGGPLTVTHPDMKRFFMTVREAVELVLQASALGLRSGVADGHIFVLDMGEPVRILDLARQMIRLAGLQPETDVAIRTTGPRPGEKLYEETFHGGETTVPSDAPGILLAAPRIVDREALAPAIEALRRACGGDDADEVLELLRRLVPESQPGQGPRPRVATA